MQTHNMSFDMSAARRAFSSDLQSAHKTFLDTINLMGTLKRSACIVLIINAIVALMVVVMAMQSTDYALHHCSATEKSHLEARKGWLTACLVIICIIVLFTVIAVITALGHHYSRKGLEMRPMLSREP